MLYIIKKAENIIKLAYNENIQEGDFIENCLSRKNMLFQLSWKY